MYKILLTQKVLFFIFYFKVQILQSGNFGKYNYSNLILIDSPLTFNTVFLSYHSC